MLALSEFEKQFRGQSNTKMTEHNFLPHPKIAGRGGFLFLKFGKNGGS